MVSRFCYQSTVCEFGPVGSYPYFVLLFLMKRTCICLLHYTFFTKHALTKMEHSTIVISLSYLQYEFKTLPGVGLLFNHRIDMIMIN